MVNHAKGILQLPNCKILKIKGGISKNKDSYYCLIVDANGTRLNVFVFEDCCSYWAVKASVEGQSKNGAIKEGETYSLDCDASIEVSTDANGFIQKIKALKLRSYTPVREQSRPEKKPEVKPIGVIAGFGNGGA